MAGTKTVALDLFAGAGGWDVAATGLGILPLGVEIMPEALETRAVAGLETAYHNAWDGLAKPQIIPHHQLLIGSPPCPTFSVAGSGEGRRRMNDLLLLLEQKVHTAPLMMQKLIEQQGIDDVTALVLTPLAYAYMTRPEYIALEQVPGALPVWEAFTKELEAWGYSVATANLHAEQYGVPQTRKRAILVARRDGKEARLPTPTHSKYYPRDPKRLDEGVLPWVSMAEALGIGLQSRPSPTIAGGGTGTGGAEPIANLQRYTESDDWILRSNYGTSGNAQNRGERSSDQPAPTITSKANRMKKLQGNQKPTGVEYQHRDEDLPAMAITSQAGSYKWKEQNSTSLRLTIEEGAVLQTFPADFPFQGGKGKQWLQVGNAIPVKLAEAILVELLDFVPTK